jgi:hypothetical protein
MVYLKIFTGYEAHELPYTIEQKTDVTELFDSLVEAIELSKSENIAKRKVISAISAKFYVGWVGALRKPTEC